MKNKEKEIELFTELFSECEEGIVYLILGSAISSDNNFSADDARENLENLEVIEEAMKKSSRPQNEKDEFLKRIADGKRILNQDIKDFENNKQ